MRKNILRVLFILLPILIIAIGVLKLHQRQNYLISLMIMACSACLFYLKYKKRGIKVAEIVLVCSLSAIAVVGRVAFYWLPQFKPVTAIIIIAAVTLGKETGFLVGAMSGFLSNFFFGQGPWTPFQMYAWALIGLLSGILFMKRKKNVYVLMIYGFVVTIIIYGGILNFASMLMMSPVCNVKMLLSFYISGIPFDVIHAIATALFLYYITNPMIEKIERIKVKYGLLEVDDEYIG